MAKSRIAAGAKRRGATPNQGAARSAADAELVALGSQFEALSTELAALQKGTVVAFSAAATPGEQLNGETAINRSAERIEGILGTP